MTPQQAAELTRALEASYPDAAITVTPEPDGAQVTISSPPMPGSATVPGGIREVSLSMREGGAM